MVVRLAQVRCTTMTTTLSGVAFAVEPDDGSSRSEIASAASVLRHRIVPPLRWRALHDRAGSQRKTVPLDSFARLTLAPSPRRSVQNESEDSIVSPPTVSSV
jgi:hypothetical protein